MPKEKQTVAINMVLFSLGVMDEFFLLRGGGGS